MYYNCYVFIPRISALYPKLISTFYLADSATKNNLDCNPVPNLNYSTLEEALSCCSKNVLCSMVLNHGGNSTVFQVCPHSDDELEYSPNSILYPKSKYKTILYQRGQIISGTSFTTMNVVDILI